MKQQYGHSSDCPLDHIRFKLQRISFNGLDSKSYPVLEAWRFSNSWYIFHSSGTTERKKIFENSQRSAGLQREENGKIRPLQSGIAFESSAFLSDMHTCTEYGRAYFAIEMKAAGDHSSIEACLPSLNLSKIEICSHEIKSSNDGSSK